jgi:hypothetical protein
VFLVINYEFLNADVCTKHALPVDFLKSAKPSGGPSNDGSVVPAGSRTATVRRQGRPTTSGIRTSSGPPILGLYLRRSDAERIGRETVSFGVPVLLLPRRAPDAPPQSAPGLARPVTATPAKPAAPAVSAPTTARSLAASAESASAPSCGPTDMVCWRCGGRRAQDQAKARVSWRPRWSADPRSRRRRITRTASSGCGRSLPRPELDAGGNDIAEHPLGSNRRSSRSHRKVAG